MVCCIIATKCRTTLLEISSYISGKNITCYFQCSVQACRCCSDGPKTWAGEGTLISYIKKEEGAHWKFWKELVRGTRILFCGRGLKCFSPVQSIPILKQYNTLFPVVFVQLNTLKVLQKLSLWTFWGSQHPSVRGTKTVFLPLEGRISIPFLFLYGIPPLERGFPGAL